MAGLTFKGKSFVQNHHLLVKYHQLIPRKDKSLTDKVSLRDNLIIHGGGTAVPGALALGLVGVALARRSRPHSSRGLQ
jgi:hypothetical protein